jgi:hypothetical protein
MKAEPVLVVIGGVLAAALCAGSAGAQTIYRCGNEYTRIPCPDGRALETADTRSAAQRAEARALIAKDRRQAAEMQRDRRRDEAATKPATASTLGPAGAASATAAGASAPKKPAAKKKRQKLAAGEADKDFIAAVPPKKKASVP